MVKIGINVEGLDGKVYSVISEVTEEQALAMLESGVDFGIVLEEIEFDFEEEPVGPLS